jgi:hypothetical protein
MNIQTEWVAKAAGVDLNEALKIQQFIDDSAMLDWSEASSRKIAQTVKLAQSVMLAGGWEKFI